MVLGERRKDHQSDLPTETMRKKRGIPHHYHTKHDLKWVKYVGRRTSRTNTHHQKVNIPKLAKVGQGCHIERCHQKENDVNGEGVDRLTNHLGPQQQPPDQIRYINKHSRCWHWQRSGKAFAEPQYQLPVADLEDLDGSQLDGKTTCNPWHKTNREH